MLIVDFIAKVSDLRGANLRGAILRGTNLMNAGYLQAEQLCEVKTLYQAKLDPELEQEVKEKHPRLFEKPGETANL